MCCGGGNQQSTVNTPNVPQWYLDAGQSLVGRAQTESQQPYQAYTGPRVAGFNTDQTDAFAATRNATGAWQPGLSAAYAATDRGAGAFPGADIGAYMSPYQQNVIDIAKREAVRQDDMARQGRDASAVGRGAFGGSRHGLVEAEARRNLGQNLSDIQMTGQQAAYNSALNQFNADQSRALAAGQQYGNLAGASQSLGLRDAAALETIGATQQGQEQRNLDTAYGDFLEQRGYPGQQLNFLSSILRGTNPQGLYPTTQTTQLPNPSIAGQVGGLGTAALGVYGLGRGFGWFARGGRVRRPGNYAMGGQVRGYQTGGLATLSTPELYLIQRDYMRRRDPRLPAINSEIVRRRSANPMTTEPGPGIRGGLSALAASTGVDRDREIEEATAGLATDRDLEGTRGLATRSPIEEAVARPLPKPPTSRPAGLAAAAPPTMDRDLEGTRGLASPIEPSVADNRDELLAENSTPYHPPAKEKSAFDDAAPWEALAAAGFKMAEAASRPGATLAGSLGAGGSEGIRQLQVRRKENRENRELDIRENRDKALIDINQKELELKRLIETDPNSPKVKRLQAEIEESRAKVATIYPAQAQYYKGLAERVGEKDDELYTIIPGDDGEAIGVTKKGGTKKLGVPYSKLKPQASESEIRMKALQIVSSIEEKQITPFTPEERQRRLREAEAYIRGGPESAPVKRYNPETRRLE
jgi:hypothetical protein